MKEKQNVKKSLKPAPQGTISSDRIRYMLELFIVDSTPRSIQAITNIARICDEHLDGRFDLEIIDISLHPSRAIADQILAAPTLIRKYPLPYRRFIGDMSHTLRILVGLGLEEAARSHSDPGPEPQCN